MNLWTTLLVAITLGGLITATAHAQAPTATPSAAAPAAGAPPVPGPPAADPALPANPAPTAQPPPPAQPPAADAWSTAIDKGRAQETTEYADVREKKEGRESRAAFEATAQPLRQRLRFFVAANLGVQSYSGLYFYSPVHGNGYTVQSVALHKLIGVGAEIGAGIRGSIAEHFDLQTRLSVAFSRPSGQMELSLESDDVSDPFYGSVDADTDATFIGVHVDGTLRWLPQLMGPRFFVGLGPQLELSSVSASSGALTSGGSSRAAPPSVDVNEMIFAAYGLLELGAIFGGQEEWEAGVRGALGASVMDHSKDVEFVGATLARAF